MSKLQIARTIRKSSGCNDCGTGQCSKMRNKNQGIHDSRKDIYWWCCLCLPIELITKPINKWLCYQCTVNHKSSLLMEAEQE